MSVANKIKMKKINIRLSIVFLLTLLTGLLLYQDALIKVISAVIHRDDSSHGIFIPFIALYFIWLKQDDLKKIEPEYNYFGIIFLLAGLFFPISGIGVFQLQFIGFILFLAGLIFVILGKDFFKSIMFPLFFLITMTPLPENLYLSLAEYSRHIAFGGALKIISMLGITYFKEGWVIQLPNASLKVAIGCSGIRYLISYVVFGLAYAWLFKSTKSGRSLVVALTIPISHFASICRLTAIFVLTYFFGPRMAETWPHIIISWIVFFTILITCIAIDQYFQKRRYEKRY